MRKLLLVSLFMLAALAWASAQQPGSMPRSSSGQTTSPGTSPGAQPPDATQSQPPGSSTAGQTGAQGGTPDASQGAAGVITEGCLGGSNPNYTITDKAGATYKLNIPPGADASSLAPHVGESVAVMGAVNNGTSKNASIDVSRIARGSSGNCPGSKSTGTQPPPK